MTPDQPPSGTQSPRGDPSTLPEWATPCRSKVSDWIVGIGFGITVTLVLGCLAWAMILLLQFGREP